MNWLGVYSVALLIAVKAVDATGPGPIARPGCKDSCGNVSIPFPFGIGPGCFLDSRYEIECRGSTPILPKFNVEVLAVGVDTGRHVHLRKLIKILLPPLKVCTSSTKGVRRLSSIDLRGSPYNFSREKTQYLLMKGCEGSTAVVSQDLKIMAGCSTVCRNKHNNLVFANRSCYGVECCQAHFSSYANGSYINPQIYHIDFYGQASPRRCLAATVIESGNFGSQIYTGSWSVLSTMTVPTLLYWSWISSVWPESDPDKLLCIHDDATNSIACACKPGHFGNPYVAGGCQGECKRCREESCKSLCNIRYRDNIFYRQSKIFLYSGIAIAALLLWFGSIWLHRFIKRRKKTEKRVKFLKLKLQQHQSSVEGVVERTKLFTLKQLDNATNHFSEKRILGRGGQGIVYKGILFDGSTVAIKKLKDMDESQIEQFINEVVILSQINHIHVVRLLGCCLETEAPLIVYEFISNGTLSQLIHDPDEDFSLTWMMRMKIAVATAQAVAYLHSYSSVPIYHRDIKSANILLDEKYRAKVSDFGCSKTIAMDQTHLTTLVQGTIGYLDPEYFYSNQYTDKSDVYSFGVVLLELMAGKKPNYTTETMEEKNLVLEFLSLIEKNQLSYILDLEIVGEVKEEEFMGVMDLARRCLSETGNLRPTMKEVAMTLERITKSLDDVPKIDDQASLHINSGMDMMVVKGVSKFRSNSMRVDASCSSYVDVPVQPLLHDTI